MLGVTQDKGAEYRHVLVTGATGFLGEHLVRFLTRQPRLKIWGVSRHGGWIDTIRIDPVRLESAQELSGWRRDKPALDAVFHLAAHVPEAFDAAEVECSLLANVSMTNNVLNLAAADKAAVVYASSGSVYGLCSKIPFQEDMQPHPNNLYSLAKYVGEHLCNIMHSRHDLPTVALRLPAPYGPGQKARTVINRFLQAAIASRDLVLYGTGERTQDFIYAGDVVEAMWLGYQRRAVGVYNIASGRPISMRALAAMVISLLPGTGSRIVTSDKPDPQENYRGEYAVDKAEKELGFHPTVSLKDGLRACLASQAGQG